VGHIPLSIQLGEMRIRDMIVAGKMELFLHLKMEDKSGKNA
jgi:hypothetical protein